MSQIVVYGRMIKFSHSIFALPFALSGAALASITAPVSMEAIVWIIVAMVGARSAAMGFNRLVDRDVDAANPRTSARELPKGVIRPKQVGVFVVVSCLAFIYAAYRLNPLCLALAPIALLVVLSYSYLKRWTWASHFVLGLGLGIAPVGAWIAVTGRLDPEPLLLALAVLTWTAGFDIIYSCQDFEFDSAAGLFSIPQRLGISRALFLSRLLHVATVICLAFMEWVFDLEVLYLIGVGLVALILVYEHTLVRADDLSKINMAFFTTNGVISVVYFLFTVSDVLVVGW